MIFAVYVLLGVVAACVHFGLLRWNASLYARKRGIAAACAVQSDGPDAVLLLPTRFGTGFMLPPALSLTARPDAFAESDPAQESTHYPHARTDRSPRASHVGSPAPPSPVEF